MTHQPMPTAEFGTVFAGELRSFAALCEQALTLTTQEMKTLSGPAAYESFDFYQKRKDLLPLLDESLISLRKRRLSWLQTSPAERACSSEVKSLFQVIQGLIMRVLLLDRENQQALLKRGLLPADHLPSAASQQPHCVSDLYRRHSHS